MIFNGNNEDVTMPLPEGSYTIVAHGGIINESGIETGITDELVVAPLSMTIAVIPS